MIRRVWLFWLCVMLLASCGMPSSRVTVNPPQSGILIGASELPEMLVCVELWPSPDLVPYGCLTVRELRAIVTHLQAAQLIQ